MLFRLAAEVTLVLHLAFIAFVVLGALLAWRWRWVPLLQLPAAAWGVYVELAGRQCPLTGLENHFRMQARQGGYMESFVERYLLAIIYPEAMAPHVPLVLAGVVLAANAAVYGALLWRRRRTRP